MKRSALWATFVAGVALICTVYTYAQTPGNPGVNPTRAPAASSGGTNGSSVAVIDLQYIFENYKRVKDALDGLKREGDAFQEKIRVTETGLKKRIEELKAEQPGTERFKQLETQIAQDKTQAQLDIANKQRELGDAQAKILARAHQDIEASISRFADRNGIDIVLQINTTPVDPNKPQTVNMALNRYVIFQRNRDITTLILDDLNRAVAGPAPRGSGPVAPNAGSSGVNPPGPRIGNNGANNGGPAKR